MALQEADEIGVAAAFSEKLLLAMRWLERKQTNGVGVLAETNPELDYPAAYCRDAREWQYVLGQLSGLADRTKRSIEVSVELDPFVVQAAREVDRSLFEWSLSLSPRQRLRACSNASLALGRFTRASSRAG